MLAYNFGTTANYEQGIFSNPKSFFWYILEGLGVETFGTPILWTLGIFCGLWAYFVNFGHILWTLGIFCGLWAYFVDFGHILWTLDIFCSLLVYFPPFWYVVLR
jgi:hypothetical protein